MIDKLKQLSKQYDEARDEERKQLPDRLKQLVDRHGLDAVSAATGLQASSVLVYTRNGSGVNEYVVRKAEEVLNSL